MDAPTLDPPATVQSLAELRERHLALLRAWSRSSAGASADMSAEAALSAEAAAESESENADLARDAEGLREAAAALGAWLDDPEERDRAQGMIDYWTAALGALPDRVYPHMLQLAPFDPALPAAAVARAEALLAEHEGTARATDADAILLRLVRPGPGDTIVCQPPLDRAFLEHADGVTDMTASQDELIDSLVDAGVIRKIPGESAELDKFDFMHGSIARACPRLKTLLDKRRNTNATRDKLRATAQLWKDSDRDRGYLLTGPVLDDAFRYRGDDGLLDEFIRASRDSEERGKRFRLILWTSLTTAALVVLLVIGYAAFYAGNNRGFTTGREIGPTIQSEAPDIIADTRDEIPGQIVAEAQPSRPPAAPGIPGWIWIGDDRIMILRALDGQAMAPAGIVAGTAYRTRTGVRLREAAPANEGDAGADAGGDAGRDSGPGQDMGMMTQGALVIARDGPRSVTRDSRTQYWLPVTLVPRLRIHFARPESQAAADALAARMRAAGYDADPPGLNANALGLARLNYYRKDDAPVAADTARRLAAGLRGANGLPPRLECALAGNVEIGTGVFDLSLDFGNLQVRQASRPGGGRGNAAAMPTPVCR